MTGVFPATLPGEIATVALRAWAGTVTDVGRLARVLSELVRETTAPPGGAGLSRVTIALHAVARARRPSRRA